MKPLNRKIEMKDLADQQFVEDEIFIKIKEMAQKEAQQTEAAITSMMRHYKIGIEELKQRVEARRTTENERRINGSSKEQTDYYVAGEKALTIIRTQRPTEKTMGFMVKIKIIKHWEE